MVFSLKTLLALIFAFAPSSLVLAQKDFVRAQTKKFEKSSNLKGGGPIRPNANDESDRDRRRRLDLSTAVNFPNPCLALPASRVPDFNDNNTANDGWTLAMGKDDSVASENLPIPFPFTLNGQIYSAIVIDNDGYVFFPGSTYNPVLNVFLADADTRGANGGYVWRRAIGNNKYAVAWDNVGYSPAQTDKLNTFQVLISDGNDPSMGMGNNVCYCYQDMQWTQGPGIVAYKFVRAGPHTSFGVFQQPGAAYDGPHGSVDGFDFLDNRSFCFKASGPNTPPVAVNAPENNRVDLDCGEPITNLTIFFLAPEDTQAVSLTSSGASAGLAVEILEQPNQATATINWMPTAAATVNVTLSASDGTDNTTVNLTFTSPGPCCQGTTAEIWNPKRNNFVQALVNGSTYCLRKYNLRAVPCQTVPISLELWNRRRTSKIILKRKKELVPPYFLWGDKVNNATGYVDVKPNPKALPNGNYALRIKAINASTNANSSYTEIRFKQSCP